MNCSFSSSPSFDYLIFIEGPLGAKHRTGTEDARWKKVQTSSLLPVELMIWGEADVICESL